MRNHYFRFLLVFCMLANISFAQQDSLQTAPIISAPISEPYLPTVNLVDYQIRMNDNNQLLFTSDNLNGVAKVHISEIGGDKKEVSLTFKNGVAAYPMELDLRGTAAEHYQGRS